MKILHITETLSGGVFSYVYQLSNALSDAGMQVSVVYSRRPETPKDLDLYFSPTVRLIELPMKREVSPLSDIKSLWNLWRIMRAEKADVIHLHSSKAGVLGRVAGSLPGVHAKVFYSPHGLAFLREDVGTSVRRLYKVFEYIAAMFGGVIIASSRSELDYVLSGIPNAKTVLVNNGIDIASLPSKTNIVSEKVRIITVNRISAQKDPAMFSRVVSGVRCTNAEFTWIGGGDENGKQKLLAAGVSVFEWMPLADALAELAHSDIFLQTSRWEGMPIVLIQAQAIGLPAVVTDVVGNRDVVLDGQTGYVCATENDLINRVNQLCSDKTLRERMGRAAMAHARSQFSVDRMSADLLNIYQT